MPLVTIDEALEALGVRDDPLSAADRERIDRDGYAVFPNLLTAEEVEKIRARIENLEEQEQTATIGTNPRDPGAIRVDDINHKGDVFDILWLHPVLLASVRHILGDFRLSSVTSRATRPGMGHQAMHADWWGGAVTGEGYVACNSGWMLDDFTAENGATRVVPGSHRSGRRPEDEMADPTAPHPDELRAVGPPGSLVVFNGYLWHSGTQNSTDRLRRGVFQVFARVDQERQNDQKALLEPATAERLSPAARRILDA